MKILIGFAFIFMIARILPHIFRLLILGKWSKKSTGQSIIGKLFMLFTREIHFKLDKQIKKQSERFKVLSSDKVVEMKKQKKAKTV